MKSLSFTLAIALMSLATVASAQSDAQKSFDKMKTLAGSWEGHATTVTRSETRIDLPSMSAAGGTVVAWLLPSPTRKNPSTK